MDREQIVNLGRREIEAIEVERARCRQQANRGLDCLCVAVESVDDPLEHPRVLAVPRPDVVAIGVLAEPVHLEDARQLLGGSEPADSEPVTPVVGHVVAAEREHRERVAAQFADCALGRGSLLARHRRTHVDAVIPVEGLGDERDVRRATAAEQDRVDRHAGGILPVGGDGRALARGRRESRIRVARRLARGGRPVLALPVDEMRGRLVRQALPPDVAVIGEGNVRVDAVRVQGLHGIGVRLHAGARRDTEETGLGVDGVQAPVITESHPGDVIADCLDLPAGHGGLEHREVGLAAGGWERRRDVVDRLLRRGQLQDEHVLGEPALVASHCRCDAQRKALLAEERVAAVAGTE